MDIVENPALYRNLMIAGVVLFGIFLIIALTLQLVLPDATLSGYGITFGAESTFLELAVFYALLSLKKVSLNEVAGAVFYGKALLRINAGLHVVPFGLMQIKKAPRGVQEFQCPGEPEKVFKGDDKDPLPEGMMRPIRAVSRAPGKGQGGILDRQMTLSVNFITQYAIIDIFDYVANFGSTEEVEKQLRDIGEIVLAETISQNTPDGFIKRLPKTNSTIVVKMRERFVNSGVDIISTRVLSPDISHDVSKEMAGIPKALAQAEQVKAAAEGEKVKRIKEGEGAASAELALLNAKADGQKAIMQKLGVKGTDVLASEAARGISDKTDVLMVGASGGMRDVMGLVKGAQSALNPGARRNQQSQKGGGQP